MFPIRFRFSELSLLGLPSKGMVCADSSSRSDLRKNGAASPNSCKSNCDMVAAPRRLQTRRDRRLLRWGQTSFVLVSGSYAVSFYFYGQKQNAAMTTRVVRKERKSTITEPEWKYTNVQRVKWHVPAKVKGKRFDCAAQSEMKSEEEVLKSSRPARKMRNDQPTKRRRKVVHWPQDGHNEMTVCWDVPSFIPCSSRSRSVDICPSLTYATSSDAHWCCASVSIDTKGKLRFCHCAKPKPAIFVSHLFYALYTLRGSGREGAAWGASLWGNVFTLCNLKGSAFVHLPGLWFVSNTQRHNLEI